MVHATLSAADGILILRPESALAAEDFQKVAALVDPHIERHGGLNRILIQAASFPGWSDFAGFLSHLRFVRDHHRSVSRVAVVSDSPLLEVAPAVANHFVQAEVRHFAAEDFEAAMVWLKTGE